MARRYWAGRDPIGKHITSGSFPTPVTVVGVAKNVSVGISGTAEPFVYLPLRQHPRFLQGPVPLVWLGRAESGGTRVAGAMRTILHDVDSSLPVTQVTTLEDHIRDLLMPQRMGSTLLSILAG